MNTVINKNNLFGIGIVVLAFLLSPLFAYVTKSIFFWQLIIPFFFIFNFRRIKRVVKNNKTLFIFLLYYTLSAVITGYGLIQTGKLTLPSFLLKYFLFLFSFSVFIVFIYIGEVKLLSDDSYWEKIDKFYKMLILVTTAVTVYHLVTRNFIPQLAFSDHQRFRNLRSIFYQSTSLFFEPRFYSLFLNALIYIELFLRRGEPKERYLVVLILCVLSTFSFGGYGVLLGQFVLFTLANIIVRQRGLLYVNKKVILLIALLVAFVLILILMGFFNALSHRFEKLGDAFLGSDIKHLLLNSYLLNYIPAFEAGLEVDIRRTSEILSIFSEISFAIFVLTRKALFGFGPVTELRFVGLNAIVEFLSRFGIVGLSIFILFLHKIFKRVDNRFYHVGFFIIGWSFIDGAIAKPLIWFSLGLIYLYLKKHNRRMNHDYIYYSGT